MFPVEMARLGRAFGFFHPLQQIELDSTVETRPYHWALVGLGMYYAPARPVGRGRRHPAPRRIPVFPLLAVGLDVVISVALTFGQTRYRSTFEVSLVLLAAVQLDWFWSRLPPGSRARSAAAPRSMTTAPANSPAPDQTDAVRPRIVPPTSALPTPAG